MPWVGDEFICSLYKQQFNKLYRAAYRMTGSREAAEDLVQDTFLLAYARRDKLAAHPVPEAWLMLTLRNLARNEQKKYLRHGDVPLTDMAELAAPKQQPPFVQLLPDGLTPQDQMILTWRFEQRMEYREMADRLGISEAACRSRVSRAVRRCRQLLGTE